MVNPATEEVFASIARSDQTLADRAIASAKAAQKKWANTAISERQAALVKVADRLDERAV